MTLRAKFVLAFVAVAAVVAATVGLVAYSTTQHALRNQRLARGGHRHLGDRWVTVDDLPAGDPGGGGDGQHGVPETIIETAQSISAAGVATHL